MATCYYCKYYRQANLFGKPDSKGVQWKKCKKKKRKVHADKKQCKLFDPELYFHCDEYGHQTSMANCLQRRYNPKGFDGWSKCTKCRQFDKHISELVNDYMIERTKISKPEKRQMRVITAGKRTRVIKRREAKPKKRKLKRRKPKRVIKRRSNSKQSPRKLKRRKKKNDD